VHQANQGAYGARNTGLTHATGRFLAFYDSDDLWWPHHVTSCIGALEAHPDIDWVYGASEIVDMASGRVIDPNCFFLHGRPKPFMGLATEPRGDLQVIVDRGLTEWSILEGIYCGLQNSVFRRSVIDRTGPFDTRFRNEAEDQLHAIRAAAAGVRFAYFTDVHLTYRIHAQNSSGPGSPTSLAKHVQLYSALFRGFEELPQQVRLSPAGQRALRRRLAREYFWHLGYHGYWQFGAHEEALGAMWRGVRRWPWDLRTAKTLATSWAKVLLGLAPERRDPGQGGTPGTTDSHA
jgi:glycosyltransferase involved in cell wall biosynthesis